MRTYRTGAHPVFDLKVHLVWITKYRYCVLTQAVGRRQRELMRQTCAAPAIEIMSGRVSTDHVHLSVSYPPDLAVSEMVRLSKGRSARRLQAEFPQLGKQYGGRRFWAVGGAPPTGTGHVTDEMIREGLIQHDQHPAHRDDDFLVE